MGWAAGEGKWRVERKKDYSDKQSLGNSGGRHGPKTRWQARGRAVHTCTEFAGTDVSVQG